MSNSDNHLSPVYTAQTNPGSTRVKTSPGSIQLCSHGQKPETPVNTNLGEPGLIFHTQASWLHSQVKLLYSVIRSIVL